MANRCTYIEGEVGVDFRKYEHAHICGLPSGVHPSWCDEHMKRVFMMHSDAEAGKGVDE